jgi:bacillithiol biosynthesis cysteine-adding enzyme BshC
LIELIDQQQRILGSFPFGPQWIEQLRTAYQPGETIAESTFQLLHGLFADRGLLILQADEASLKSSMQAIFLDELTQSSAAGLVAETDRLLQQNGYKNQAYPRPINLFYLQPGSRERIEKNGSLWQVSNSSVQWDESSLRAEWAAHPERFSPNVILRGIYQETILPNLVYIGGGGELAYWLQLRSVFDYHQVPFPLLQLRASFQWLDASMGSKMKDLQLKPSDLFKTTDQLLDERLDAAVLELLNIESSIQEVAVVYENLRMKAKAIDPTLEQHVQALATRSLQRIEELQKKMKRAERRKYATRRIQIDSLKLNVFPGDGLQERYENLATYYVTQGTSYFDRIYEALNVWDNKFTWLQESD